MLANRDEPELASSLVRKARVSSAFDLLGWKSAAGFQDPSFRLGLNNVHLPRSRPRATATDAPKPRRQPLTETKETMATLQDITDRMKTAVGTDSGLGKTLKFNLKSDGVVYIDGGSVTNDDKPADLTLTISMDDLISLGEGKLDPMTAVMTGALGLSDMGVAMGLQGKMQALFSKLQ